MVTGGRGEVGARVYQTVVTGYRGGRDHVMLQRLLTEDVSVWRVTVQLIQRRGGVTMGSVKVR